MLEKNTAIVSLFLLITTAFALPTYCPAASDLLVAYSTNGKNVRLLDQGWTTVGGGGASTKAAFNLLGGSVEYDIDVSSVKSGVNANIYTFSPKGVDKNIGYQGKNYCDGQGQSGTDKWCVEVDWIESNGHCGGQTTLHTIAGGGNGCTAWGCGGSYHYNSKTSFHMKVTYGANGAWQTYVDGKLVSINPAPKASDLQTLAKYYKERGAVIYSSQWVGWVPLSDCGGNGSSSDLSSSSFSIRNLKITGTVVQGPTPRKC